MKANLSPAAISPLTALIVEDNEHMRRLLRALLQAMGVRLIYEAADGTAGLAQLAARRPDFILADLSMAPMDGLDFTRAVRRLPDAADCVLPIIMVTGHTEKHRIQAARDAGVSEILAKPVTPAGLLHRIEEIVLRPRVFVRSPHYAGPCRRRHDAPDYAGPWRREADGALKDGFALDSQPASAR